MMIGIERTAYQDYTIRDPLEGRMDDPTRTGRSPAGQ